MFFGKGLHIGRIGGIAVGIDCSWFIIFGLFVYLLARLILPGLAPGVAASWYWITALGTALLISMESVSSI